MRAGVFALLAREDAALLFAAIPDGTSSSL
jgi:hypothetical protein